MQMNKLFIEATDISPKVDFNTETNVFVLEGESRPENVRKFYDPLIEWLENYNNTALGGHNLTFEFRFDYFNSSSAKFIMDILKILEKIKSKNININIKWYYDEDDEDMLETGEEFSRIIDLTFEYIKN